MSHTLFIDVTEEQQEIVAGGLLSVPNLSDYNYAKFNQNIKLVQFATKAVVGPNGSSSTKSFQALDNKISSSAGDILKFKW